MRLRRFVPVLGAVLLLALTGPPLFAQTGSIRGTVTDQATGQPISAALISVVGTNRQIRTGQDGTYELVGLPVGNVTIRAAIIGYAAQTRTLAVVAAAPVTANFALTQAAISLDALVVTATGEQRAVEVPNVITTVNAAQAAEEVAPVSLSSVLQGRAPGVQVINSSGSAGSGTKIRIRGSSSMSLTNEPLLVVDGVRVDNRSNDSFLGTGGQTISRINDFNPDEIESIEVVKGPSAAALYGTEAANGVIVIKTKRGRVGAPVWNVYGEYGLVSDVNEYPTNFTGLDASGSPCRTYNLAAGSCTQAELQSANPLESSNTTPISGGQRQQFGMNVAGGTPDVQYFLSAEYEQEDGVYTLPQGTQDSILAARPEGFQIPDFVLNPNQVQRTSLRANLNMQLSEKLSASISTGYVDGNFKLPENDNNVLGMLPSGLLGGSDSTDVGGWGFSAPEEVFWIDHNQEIQRFTQSATANFLPTDWLEFRGLVGVDFASMSDVAFQAIGTGPDFSNYKDDGARDSDKRSTWQYTFDLGGTAQFQLTDAISSRTSAGVQYFRNYRNSVETRGEKLPPGAGSNDAATDQFIDEDYIETRTLGTYIEQQFGLNDRLFVTAAVRGDDNSAFGEDFDYTVYPKVGASYLVIDRGFGVVDNLRLRAAWGASGVQPGTNDAVLFFTGEVLAEGGVDKTGVVISNPGNSDLKPERSTEWEAGFEAGLFGGRLGVDLTYYRRTTKDALVDRDLAPSLGLTTSRFENLAKTRNWGFEGGINGTVFQSPMVTWNFSLTGSTNSNEVVELGEDVEPIIFGNQAHKEGYPLGAFWDEPFTWDDANGDGYIAADEITRGDTTEFIGYARPRYEVSLFNSFDVSSWLRISGLFDYRGGHHQYNNTERFRCRFRTCQELNDPTTPLEGQARAVAAAIASSQTAAGYIEPAWFIKLRELSFTFFMPQSMAGMVGASRANLTISGRNLLTITDYTGVDPEVQGNTGNFGSSDFLTQPQVRYWTARVQLTF
jgi:TonB-linked SusC/RagA family outer membrane protein